MSQTTADQRDQRDAFFKDVNIGIGICSNKY